MLVHPWDASVSDDEWREWLGTIAPFGQLVVNNADPAHAPLAIPTHAVLDGEELLIHVARPNPVWPHLERSAHVEAGHLNLPQRSRSQGHAPPVETALDGKETPMAPATSLARLRKQVLDLVMSGRMAVNEACRSLGISRSRYYELRTRYLTYGEAGLLPKPRPAERPDRRLPAPLTDQIIAYTIHHPTAGPRTIAAALALPRFGAWRVSHGGVAGVLGRAGLNRMSARLAAAEALSAAEGGPITERALRDLRAQEVTHRHIGSDTLGEQVFFDTMFVGRLKGVGKIWQYSAVEGACSFGFATVRRGEKRARSAAEYPLKSCRSLGVSALGVESRSRSDAVRCFHLHGRARQLSPLSSGSARGHHVLSCFG